MERVIRTGQLFLILQERQRQEEADIMALGKDGTLYLFELKRWQGREENLLQVLRYGQRFGGTNTIGCTVSSARINIVVETPPKPSPFKMLIGNTFAFNEPLAKDSFNKKQRLVVVTNGLDRATYDAIEYWRNYQIPIDSLVYRCYREESSSRVLVDFDPYGPDAYSSMLNDNKAAAYSGRKWGIAAIRRGSAVCLFHVNVGVIAIGNATSDYCRAVYDGEPDAEFFVPCRFDYKVDPIGDPIAQ
jgi:hypothetical protein